MKYQIITEPATEPLLLAEAKEHLRLDGTDEDTLVTALITAARRFCENYTNRVFIDQEWEVYYNDFIEPLTIPVNPVSAVNSISYVDTNEAPQTLAGANYQVDLKADIAQVFEGVTLGFPSTSTSTINPITVNFQAGYANAAAVPEDIKQAIRVMISYFFENREMINVPMASIATQIQVPVAVYHLLARYRVLNFGA